jgi:hypothetical protein
MPSERLGAARRNTGSLEVGDERVAVGVKIGKTAQRRSYILGKSVIHLAACFSLASVRRSVLVGSSEACHTVCPAGQQMA